MQVALHVGAALCQDHGNGLQPCAFMSRKMNDAERNYPVHEQELLAIMHALREWRHYLHGNKFIISQITDHCSTYKHKTSCPVARYAGVSSYSNLISRLGIDLVKTIQ